MPDGWIGLDIGPRTAERYARESAGGETVAALRRYGREDSVTRTSTGGGATRELFEGRRLPGVQALLRLAGAP